MPSRAGRPTSAETDQRQWATFKLLMPREIYDEVRETIELAKKVGVDVGNDVEALRSICAEFYGTYLAIHASNPPQTAYQALKRAVHERDGWRCVNCTAVDQLTVHHITPRSHQGKDRMENCITLCVDCHETVQPCWREWRPILLTKIHASYVEDEA